MSEFLAEAKRKRGALILRQFVHRFAERQTLAGAFRGFVRTGHPLAGSPAPDLLAWRAWGAVPEYVELLKAGVPQHPASTYAILAYLDAAPQPEARAAAAAARAAGR